MKEIMTKYSVRKQNPISKGWILYHSTFDISDAYNVHAQLLNSGCKASITQEYVKEQGV